MLKTGRLPRQFNPMVPHLSALIAGKRLPPPPSTVNYLASMPNDLGMMLNSTLGCCTIAGIYHSIQVWTHVASSHMQTNPDSDVLKVYESFCGYDPSHPSTDQGGVEQDVLGDWLNEGVPLGNGGTNKLAAFIEVDVRNETDIKRVIDECGVCYIGFNVPSNIMPDNAMPPAVWKVQPGAQIIGGHCVVLAGYDANVAHLISWGQKYEMTWDFFQKYTDEAYSLVDIDWVKATGKTPLGMSLSTLTTQMNALKIHH
jgi:hypothetical protein